MRCQGCGRQAAIGAVQCAACGDSLRSGVTIADAATAALPTEWQSQAPTASGFHLPTAAPRRVPAPRRPQAVAARPAAAVPAPSTGQVQGRVILVEGPVIEPVGFDGALLLCQVLWLGLMLLLPLLLLRALIAVLVAVPGILLLLAIAWFMGLLSPRHLLEAMSLIFRMGQWGRQGGDTIPVRYLRIRDQETNREGIVRLVGHLSAGNVLVDDRVAFYGRERHGVLYATRGRNLRTGSRIRLRMLRSRFLLIVTLLVYGLIAVMFVALSNGFHPTGA